MRDAGPWSRPPGHLPLQCPAGLAGWPAGPPAGQRHPADGLQQGPPTAPRWVVLPRWLVGGCGAAARTRCLGRLGAACRASREGLTAPPAVLTPAPQAPSPCPTWGARRTPTCTTWPIATTAWQRSPCCSWTRRRSTREPPPVPSHPSPPAAAGAAALLAGSSAPQRSPPCCCRRRRRRLRASPALLSPQRRPRRRAGAALAPRTRPPSGVLLCGPGLPRASVRIPAGQARPGLGDCR